MPQRPLPWSHVLLRYLEVLWVLLWLRRVPTYGTDKQQPVARGLALFN